MYVLYSNPICLYILCSVCECIQSPKTSTVHTTYDVRKRFNKRIIYKHRPRSLRIKTEVPHHLTSSTKAYKCPGQIYVYIGVFLHLLPATERLRIVYYRNRRSSIEFYKLLILFHNCLAPFLLLLSRFNSQYNNHLLFLL